MKTRKLLLTILAFFLLTVFRPALANAAPRLFLDPSSGNFSNGDQIEVAVSIDAGDQEVMATDTLLNFDSSKLEVTSVTDGGFFEEMQYVTDDGRVTIYAYPKQALQTKTGTGILAQIVFTALAEGTASASFLCEAGSDSDSNIWTAEGNDVIDCAANGSGSYIIGTSGGETTPTPTPTISTGTGTPTLTPTPTTTDSVTNTPTPTTATGSGATATPTPSELPETGFEIPAIVLLLGGGIMVLLGLAMAF